MNKLLDILRDPVWQGFATVITLTFGFIFFIKPNLRDKVRKLIAELPRNPYVARIVPLILIFSFGIFTGAFIFQHGSTSQAPTPNSAQSQILIPTPNIKTTVQAAIKATQTAQPTATPTHTMTPTHTPTPTTIEPANSIFYWLEDEIDKSVFFTTNAASFTLDEYGLRISGASLGDRVWIDKKLPENFRATINFRLLEPKQHLSVGFGNGEPLKSSYVVELASDAVYFTKYRDQDVWYYGLEITVGDFVKQTEPNLFILERNERVVRVFINQVLVIRIESDDDPEMNEINDFDYLFFHPSVQGNSESSALVQKFLLEQIPTD